MLPSSGPYECEQHFKMICQQPQCRAFQNIQSYTDETTQAGDTVSTRERDYLVLSLSRFSLLCLLWSFVECKGKKKCINLRKKQTGNKKEEEILWKQTDIEDAESLPCKFDGASVSDPGLMIPAFKTYSVIFSFQCLHS